MFIYGPLELLGFFSNMPFYFGDNYFNFLYKEVLKMLSFQLHSYTIVHRSNGREIPFSKLGQGGKASALHLQIWLSYMKLCSTEK